MQSVDEILIKIHSICSFAPILCSNVQMEDVMPKNHRDEELLSLINSAGYMSVGDLAEKTYTSSSTVRRALSRLEQQGLIRRRHNGAESLLTLRPPLIVRRQYNQAQKIASAERAAKLVKSDSTIFIDESTTVQYMIPHLASIEGLTVFTYVEMGI